jgi:preprotein translocase subunit SecF
MFELLPKNTNFDFVGKRKIFLSISLIFMLTSMVLLFTKGLNYGIDFTGGAEVQIKFKNTYSIQNLRSVLNEVGLKNLNIQELSEGREALEARSSTYRLRFMADEKDLQKVGEKIKEALASKMQTDAFEIQRVDVVGPQAGSELRKSGFLAMFYALLCILIYVAIRFDMRYSPGAVFALFHDTLITLGVFVVTQKEFSLPIVAALLTVIGYSNNDTIIVYDRVRETMKLFPNDSIEKNVNRSINETLSRTILTSLTTAFVTIALMLFGGGVVAEFAFTMTVGIIVGTYSSIFIAAPTLIFLTNYYKKKDSKKNLTNSLKTEKIKA